VDALRKHPARTSAVAGVVVAVLLIDVRSVSPVGVVLALVVGLVFGVSMYVGMRNLIRRS
jgi:hypothetical protein